ncbi:hypothetical protein P5V15_010182 [Pogonomyrmex californicus]
MNIIVPLYRKEDQEQVENYRGISLCTAYKVYAEIVRRSLEKKAEVKELLPEGQAGFRKVNYGQHFYIESYNAKKE